MGWHREVAETSFDDLVRANAGDEQFVIGQWQRACQDYLDLCERVDQSRAVCSWQEQVGRLMLSAKIAGRKTVRIDDILVAAGIPSGIAEELDQAGHPVAGADGQNGN